MKKLSIIDLFHSKQVKQPKKAESPEQIQVSKDAIEYCMLELKKSFKELCNN